MSGHPYRFGFRGFGKGSVVTDMTRNDVASDDEVVAALSELETTVIENIADERVLVRRVRRLRSARSSGRSWRDVLGSEPEPGTLTLVGRVLGRMSESSGNVRRALARALRNEGLTISGIAKRFNVTHQRISSLIKSPRS